MKHINVINVIQVVAAWLALWLLGTVVAWQFLSVPVVRISNATGECVEVIPADAGNCANLPITYFTEIVQ